MYSFTVNSAILHITVYTSSTIPILIPIDRRRAAVCVPFSINYYYYWLLAIGCALTQSILQVSCGPGRLGCVIRFFGTRNSTPPPWYWFGSIGIGYVTLCNFAISNFGAAPLAKAQKPNTAYYEHKKATALFETESLRPC